MTAEFEQDFIRLANSITHWQVSAQALRICAEEIGKRYSASVRDVLTDNTALEHWTNTAQVFLMLAGMSVENLAKALLIRRGKASVGKGRLDGSGLKAHGAIRLLERAGIALSSSESELIKRLDKAVLWSGRYPIPTDAERFEADRVHLARLEDLDEFRMLFDRLTFELSRKAKP